MQETTELQYVATTLPRAASSAITHNSAYTSPLPQHQTEIQKQLQQLQQQQQQQQQHHRIESEQLQYKYKECRPTYGAYINNTLPRGPYLQYKFNDQQSAYSKRNDNNQKNRQIELLKHEFMLLPRAKIKISCGNELPSPTNNNNCFNGIQTLGRHRYTNQSNRTTAQGFSSLDYYNKNGKNPHWNDNDNSYSVMNQCRNDKTTKLDIPNSIETVNCNALYKRNSIRCESNDNVIANNTDYICNYNHETFRKNDFNHKTPATDIQQRNVGKQIESSEHFDMMGKDLNNFLAKIEPTRNAIRKDSRCGNAAANRVNIPINYVTLLEIMKVKENGFSQIEGWAILCQSIQALQDLFLADTPSTNRLLPLVNLSNLQITSRGRVVFNVIPAGQIMNSDNSVTPFSDTCFLSPEYLSSVGKKTSFSESDIEKMWIYSLGITLHKAIPSTSGITSTNRTISGSLPKINNDRKNDYDVAPVPSTATSTDMTMYNHHQHHSNELDRMLTSLDCVISAMCAPKLYNRASLMYLLDVISEYCRCHHQIKPFSHIVMDLFQEALAKSKIGVIDHHASKLAVNKKTAAFDNRSDTDSGHSSAQGDRDIYTVYNNEPERNNNVCDKRTLKVSRTKATTAIKDYHPPSDQLFNKFNPTGYSAQNEMEEKPLELPVKRLQVTRRRDEILKRRNRSRRNTIAVNFLDVKKERNLCHSSASWDGTGSKSTNCIDKIGNGTSFAKKLNETELNGCSMPELNAMKFATLPNLKVRRAKDTTNSSDGVNDLVTTKSKGPEFIANSSLSPREIDITDIKCQHNKRAVIVLLLNGKSIKITCNPAAATAQEIFETVIKCENFVENFFLGICALIGGDFVFLPADLKIHKVAPEIWFNASKKGCYTENVIFTLFLRTKFYLPTLRGISSLESRHLLYLQLRKSILESHILCNDEELISLGGLALQSEIGDFTESMKNIDYFTISHYLPEGVYQRNKGMAKYLRNSHYAKRGLHSRESEYNFIRYVQEMKEYGLHLFSAIWTTDDGLTYDVYVAVSLSGIRIFRRSSTSRQDQPVEHAKRSKTDYQRKLYANFEWLEIENLCFSKHILCVVIRKSESLKAKDNNRVKYKFRMDGRKSYFAFHLASEHHRFYMKLRNSFISLKVLSDELNYPLHTAMRSDTCQAQIIDQRPHTINIDEPNHPMDAMTKKSDKTAEGRVGRLKKSMLNDNRLLKLRNKFLKRSKSSVTKQSICLNPNGQSKEENQNKENECPKFELKQSQPQNLLLSPNRNRVKMGTRVFSAQFLNKSFDNVSDSNGFNMYRFDSNDYLDDADAYRGKTCTFAQCERDNSDDCMSLTSTSLSSLYYSEKMSEKFTASPLPTEAYVLQSSMKSDINQFSMFNETISDSLFEKFNNLSKNNTIGDRVINRITIIKDSLTNIYGSVKGSGGKMSLDSDGGSSIEENSLANRLTLGISIVQGSDNNVYVKDLVRNGPGEMNGIQIGDQILAVNGKSLLNLSYGQSLKILQNTGTTVELTVSQIYNKKPVIASPMKHVSNNVQLAKTSTVRSITRNMKNSFKFKKDRKDVDTGNAGHKMNGNVNENNCQRNGNSSGADVAIRSRQKENEKTTIKMRSMPDLPKVVGTIPKHQINDKGTLPRTMGLSRKYIGPVRYPVTPIRPSNSAEKQRLSLLADNLDKQVYI